jgi:hypothetical protein
VSEGITTCILIGRLEFFRFATPSMIRLMYDNIGASYQEYQEIMSEYNEIVQWDGYKNSVVKDFNLRY